MVFASPASRAFGFFVFFRFSQWFSRVSVGGDLGALELVAWSAMGLQAWYSKGHKGALGPCGAPVGPWGPLWGLLECFWSLLGSFPYISLLNPY